MKRQKTSDSSTDSETSKTINHDLPISLCSLICSFVDIESRVRILPRLCKTFRHANTSKLSFDRVIVDLSWITAFPKQEGKLGREYPPPVKAIPKLESFGRYFRSSGLKHVRMDCEQYCDRCASTVCMFWQQSLECLQLLSSISPSDRNWLRCSMPVFRGPGTPPLFNLAISLAPRLRFLQCGNLTCTYIPWLERLESLRALVCESTDGDFLVALSKSHVWKNLELLAVTFGWEQNFENEFWHGKPTIDLTLLEKSQKLRFLVLKVDQLMTHHVTIQWPTDLHDKFPRLEQQLETRHPKIHEWWLMNSMDDRRWFPFEFL